MTPTPELKRLAERCTGGDPWYTADDLQCQSIPHLIPQDRAYIAAANPARVLHLIEENERMREAGDKLFRAFSNPITRRQLGGHDERQMEAVLSWREATKPPEASHD